MNVREKLLEMVREDLGKGDVTSEVLVGNDVVTKAEIIAKGHGVLAGVKEATALFRLLGVKVKILKRDGSEIAPNIRIMELSGKARKILAGERTALNLLMRMSGIATTTRKFVEEARKGNLRVIVAATRKTAPLLTVFDKRAVAIGGGSPHRYTLSDQILIKDNHIKIVGSVEKAVKMAKSARKGKVEVEVTNARDALVAAKAGADIVMLDNMSVGEMKKAVRLLKKHGLKKVILEASGGIDLSNVRRVAATGVDVVSSSYITLRAPPVDMSLEIML
ncbi:MAG: carboxylating nicotinate-nucleotide diphosphorylase [Candidatus Hadarchaeales archaeon]